MDKSQLPKMLKKLYLFLLLLCSLTGFEGYTQTFPISVNTQITQPSPIYLSKYADATSINSPIKIQLVLNDLTISNRQVRLKIYFQGNGVSFSNNDFVVGAKPLYLEGGFPLQLTNVDLAPYFQYQNLLGLNPNQYAQPLPEGISNFYVEVYDFATGKKLSRKTGTTTVIFQNEPPFLNLPLNNASIMQQNIQNIVFSWTPRSINVSNVEYEFSLVEIWDNYTPVQNAFAYSPPLYTTTTKMTTLQYGMSEPQLIPGKKYAWRIKAKAILGAEEIGVFKNNGYTEIFAFTYEVFCTSPLAVKTESISQDQAKISWSGNIDNFDYRVNYREKNSGSQWYKAVTPRENIILSNLKPNTTYEYTVGASCDVGKYIHSSIYEFTTIARDEIVFQGCGIKPDPRDLANQTPLPELFPNDVITAGDFPIVVLKAIGSNGNFSGEGYVTLPFLEKFRKLIDAADALGAKDENGASKGNLSENTRIRITFNNVGVNSDFKLISGEIIAAYDPTWSGISDLDGVINDTFGDAGNVVNQDIQFPIKSVVKNPDGSITITGPDDVKVNLPKTVNDIIITDKNGKQYAVPANAPAGNIEKTGQLAPGGIPNSKNTNGMGSGGSVTEISSPDINVIFSKGNGTYAFDNAPAAANGSLGKTYETIPQKSGGTYNVNLKAISNSPNKTDIVIATANFKNGKTQKDIVFKTQNGTAIDSTQIVWNDNVATLTLKKTLDFAKETVIATVKPATSKDPKETAGKYDIAGAIDLWHLTNKKVNVTLVSVNNASIPSNVTGQLNTIYEPAGITFDVSTLNVTLDNTWGESIETSDSDLVNTYTPDQQQITNNLKAKLGADYKKDTYYIIYTGAPSDKSNILGFMPLKRQYGFIFNKTNTVRTLAHELGHGVFGLKHPFTEYNTATTTDLLMDYGTGVLLNHNDWQVLHAPGLQLYPFIQGDSAGELAGGYGLTPDWHFVRTNESTILSGSQVPVVGEGMLGGFESTENGKTINYIWNKNSNTYKVDGTGTDYPTTNYKDKLEDKVVVWLIYKNNEDCSKRKYIRTYYSQIKTDLPKHDLTEYITKIDKIEKADKLEIFSNILGCVGSNTDGNNSESGNYTNYVVNLAKDANKKYTEDKTEVSTQEAHLFDLATVISDKEKQKILSQLVGIKQSTKILTKIYLVDSKTPETKKTEINNYLNSLKGKEIGLLIDFTNASDPAIKTFLGDGIEGKGTAQMDKYLKALLEVLPKFDGTYTPFNPLTAMLDGLAGVIGEAKIPIRFYNPDEKDYNPIPGQVYSLLTFSIVKDKLNNFVSNNNAYVAKYSDNRCSFAFTCGVWNGLVGAVGGVPEGASMIIKLITNEDDQAVKLWDGLSKLSWSTIGDLAGDQWNKYSANPCMASYATGEVGFVVISCFYGAGEAKGLATFLQTLDRLDAVGALMGKFAKISSPFIKAGVNKFGKFVVTPLAKLEPGLSQKLREALAANFNKLLKNSEQLSLSLHATDQGKFIVDGIERSPEELGELLSKKLSNKKEIILLSCNDLDSARALSEATGKVVYTTDGAMTAYGRGIRRAEGTNWYRIEPNGTATKVDTPPVNECPKCDGPDGVEMGKRKEFILNTPEDLYKKIEYYRATVREVINTEEARAYALKYFNKNVKGQTFEEWWANAKKYNVADDLNFEIHHIIPVKVLGKNPKLKELLFWAEKNGKKFEFNGLDNSIPIQKKKAKIDLNGHTNHPAYDRAIEQKIDEICSDPNLDNVGKFEEIQDLINDTKIKLENEVLLGNKDVNQIINF
ncbi:AHH domain-containing protein [Flavobacterium collinsii]|uniref:AHH domain-containing protein n=1 Tax=Flavobacterium collinsii TaxID=1114861 RepID=UPI0037579EE1